MSCFWNRQLKNIYIDRQPFGPQHKPPQCDNVYITPPSILSHCEVRRRNRPSVWHIKGSLHKKNNQHVPQTCGRWHAVHVDSNSNKIQNFLRVWITQILHTITCVVMSLIPTVDIRNTLQHTHSTKKCIQRNTLQHTATHTMTCIS